MAVPSDIAGLQLWLKADAITGLSDGDAVTTWPDSSGLSNNASQATASLKPIYKTNIVNGNPVVRFDGTDDYLSSAASASLANVSLFVVCSWTNVSARRAIVGCSDSFSMLYAVDTDAKQFFVKENAAVVAQGSSVLTAGTFYRLSASYSGTVGNVYANGTANGSTTITDPFVSGRTVIIGNNIPATRPHPFLGDIAEVFMFDTVLSNANRQAMDDYLSSRYVPGSHARTVQRLVSTHTG